MYEDMIATNPKYAQVAAFGNWGSAEDAVYSNWEEKDFDIPSIKARDDLKFVFGLDFGFSVSYNAFVAAAIEPMTKTMWIYDELYFKGKTNVDIAKTIIAAGYGREEIWADCQEGKSIKELQDGFIEMHDEGNGIEVPTRYILPRIRSAIKGPDSVRVGIAKVNEFHIFVHPSCVNMITELTNYSYSRDKDGRLTDKPEKDYDHLCDALRYAITGEFQKGHGAVVEARGGAFGHPRIGATTSPDDEPVNTFKHVPYVDATGPADAAPPRKKCVRVFSSVKYDDNGYSDILYDRPWRGF